MNQAAVSLLERVAPEALNAAAEHFRAAGELVTAALLLEQGPPLLRVLLDAVREQHEGRERHGRAMFVAELASRFVVGAFETGEDSTTDEARQQARRAVRMAELLLECAEAKR